MDNTFSQSVKKLCADYSGIITSSGVFSGNESASLNRSITEDVMPLLNFEKPRILVYGIYNSGKSTLVNAIMKKEVAEVGNRPTTHRTAEYDAGKYILVDSPGIDAHSEEDERIADSYIKSCHVILFLASTAGGFESGTNYEKMWSLIQMNLPFIIVLNERAVQDSEKASHLADINSIKRKVIENLIRVSGQRDVESRYDVIVLNAQRAWQGVQTGEDLFTEESHISDLTNRIEQLLEGREAMKTFLAPLSAVERKTEEAEKILNAKTAGNDYATKRATLQNKIAVFREKFNEDLRFIAERHHDEIYQGFLGRTQTDMSRIYNDICRDAENLYRNSATPILGYIRANFSELNIIVDDNGRVTLNTPQEEMKGYSDDTKEYDREDMYIEPVSTRSGSNAMTAAGTALGSIIGTFVPVLGTIAGGVIGGALGKLADVFMSSAGREREEYDRRLREVEAYNERQERRAEEENRRRQDARMSASNQINAIVRDLRNAYAEVIDQNFGGVMNLIDAAISRIAKTNTAIRNTLGQLKELRVKINDLRRQITC